MKVSEIIVEAQMVPAAQILRYVKQVHPEGEFNIDHVITDHAHWQEADVPISNLHIFDPEQDDIYDPYNRVQDTNLHHVDRLIPNIAAILQKKPLVIDDAGYILDGNHRALAALKAGLQTVPVWQPAKSRRGVAEVEGGLGQVAGIGINGKQFNFSIKDLIAKAQNYPIKKLNPQIFGKQLADRHEDPKQTAARAQLADLQYPIIVVQDGNTLMIADGTHRAQKAIMNKLPAINAHVIPVKDMAEFSKQGVEEAGGPDMSRRGFMGGLGALLASSGLPKVAAGALQQILGITTPEHLENMQYALKSRGTLLQLTNDELDKISSAIKGAPLDAWPGFRGTHKSVYGNPLIDQAYRKLTGEDMKAARVARILKDNSIDPVKFFESPTVKAVIGKVRQEIAAKWAQSGASDEPFKSPGEPPKMDDKKVRELEKKRDKAYKELKNRNSDKSTKGTAGGRMGPITLPLKPTHINSVATNAQTLPNYKQLNKE